MVIVMPEVGKIRVFAFIRENKILIFVYFLYELLYDLRFCIYKSSVIFGYKFSHYKPSLFVCLVILIKLIETKNMLLKQSILCKFRIA